MKLLAALTELFINAFQITRPSAQQQHRAQIIIGGLTLLAIVVAVSLLVGMLVWAFRG